jgi:hypothetical protein
MKDFNLKNFLVENKLTNNSKELDEDYEVAMAKDSLDSIIRAVMMLKAQIGDQEVNLPAWIQDHITNAENYINQAAKGYHESDAQIDDEAGELEEMDESIELNEDNLHVKSIAKDIYSTLKKNGVNAKLIASIPRTGYQGKSIGATLTGGSNEALVFYWDDTKTKLTTIEIYLSGDKEDVLSFEKKILSSFPGLEQYSRVEYPTPQAFKLNFRVKEKTTAKGGIQESNDDKERKEELKQAQLEKAYDHLEKMKAKPRLFTKEDLEKAQARIDKLEAELDALASK